ncbi:MAG TPA: carbohydrate ABC transporter permease [Clostridiaceae bacterium]|nr:carbohydrate ABC transporter permease [Clostridiaceae bacterium]
MRLKLAIQKFIFEIIMIFFSICMLAPFWMVLVNSFKPKADANRLSAALPAVWNFENYAIVFKEGKLLRAFFNGVIVSFFSVALIILFSSMAGFVISRKNSRLTNKAYFLFISGLIVPSAMIPTYWILSNLKLVNTYPGLISIYVTYGLPFSIFMYVGFIKTIPREIDEAAYIDGASQLKMFYSVVFPLLKPTTVTVLIFNIMNVWNDVQIQMYFADAKKWSMPMSVYGFFGKYSTNWNLVFADIVLTILPVVIVYAFLQKHIISGMTAGSVKG